MNSVKIMAVATCSTCGKEEAYSASLSVDLSTEQDSLGNVWTEADLVLEPTCPKGWSNSNRGREVFCSDKCELVAWRSKS